MAETYVINELGNVYPVDSEHVERVLTDQCRRATYAEAQAFYTLTNQVFPTSDPALFAPEEAPPALAKPAAKTAPVVADAPAASPAAV